MLTLPIVYSSDLKGVLVVLLNKTSGYGNSVSFLDTTVQKCTLVLVCDQ